MSWDLVECLALSSLTSYHTWDAAGSVAVLMVLSDATALSSTLSSLTWDASGSGVLVLLFLCNANVLSVKFSYYVSICWKSTHYAHEQADMRANHHTEDDERVGGWDLWCGIIQVSELWVLEVDVKVLKSWQHKENQLTAVKDVAAPAPPPEPPPTPK